MLSDGCDDAAGRIAALAKKRKNARLGHIERSEEIEEHYLHSSHLRNQSVFMQLFADTEAYASSGDVSSLDMLDLRNIASAQLNNLR